MAEPASYPIHSLMELASRHLEEIRASKVYSSSALEFLTAVEAACCQYAAQQRSSEENADGR